MYNLNQNKPKRFVRNLKNGILSGVCSGLEDYTDIDANIWRGIFLIGTLFGAISCVVYFMLWLVSEEK